MPDFPLKKVRLFPGCDIGTHNATWKRKATKIPAKIHKRGIPLGIIISSISVVPYNIAKLLISVLAPLKSSIDFVKKI